MGEVENEAVVLTFAEHASLSRYALRRDGELVATLDHRDDGMTVAARAYTVLAVHGQSHAGEITSRAVTAIEARGGRTVRAERPYVAAWFRRHPERADILA
ncbi:GNAT family N-acetyltransferase [Promicromonospora sukumoe]|uniref:Uncharacterized protein n=1 Tax=Promicromonospora sukumoe TaxID=88382 RepID=A0A7W3J7G9_9MICO|nr:N-acetyltransferase [Promicromonospora sukumoe]MBA8807712.1 hypothetical protein [Promicromonospora sukumoe]